MGTRQHSGHDEGPAYVRSVPASIRRTRMTEVKNDTRAKGDRTLVKKDYVDMTRENHRKRQISHIRLS